MIRKHLARFASLAMLFAAVGTASAQFTVLTSGHYDIGADLDGSDLHGHIHQHSPTEVEYETSEAGFWAKDNHLATRASGSQWDFIGVGAGQQYYRLPQNNQTGKLYLGFGVEEIDPDSIDSWSISDSRVENIYGTDPAKFIKWSLKSVTSSTGGAFSIWNGSTGVDPVWISSANGIDSSDFFVQEAGGHDHVNWGFSKAGIYGITFTITSMVGGQMVSSDATYTFGIGTAYQPTSAVTATPEPATLTLLAAGAVAVRRRRQRAV